MLLQSHLVSLRKQISCLINSNYLCIHSERKKNNKIKVPLNKHFETLNSVAMTNFSLAFMHEIIVISNRIAFNWNRKWNFFVCIFVFPIRIHWLLALMGEFKFLLHFETDKTYLWKFHASAIWKKKKWQFNFQQDAKKMRECFMIRLCKRITIWLRYYL